PFLPVWRLQRARHSALLPVTVPPTYPRRLRAARGKSPLVRSRIEFPPTLALISSVPTEPNPESGPSASAATYHQTSAAWTDTLAAPRFRRFGAQRLRRNFPT